MAVISKFLISKVKTLFTIIHFQVKVMLYIIVCFCIKKEFCIILFVDAFITSLSYSPTSDYLSIGLNSGQVKVFGEPLTTAFKKPFTLPMPEVNNAHGSCILEVNFIHGNVSMTMFLADTCCCSDINDIFTGLSNTCSWT